ncbi:MAG: DUF2782 domain-containing protein [Pseudomonadales bacterium]|jgi:hypothetical protein|nr:DUF2782 domain-containing protein [Pseudomonadales bacterium]
MRSGPGRAPLVRGILVTIVSALAGSAIAADDTRVSPRGRDVTIIEGEDRTVYEYRQNGELRMIRIVPSTGRPYYLVPADSTSGYGNLEKADTLVPKWILLEF